MVCNPEVDASSEGAVAVVAGADEVDSAILLMSAVVFLGAQRKKAGERVVCPEMLLLFLLGSR